MKIHRVEMTAFGPFRDTEVVDFDAFDADGLFLIAGRTGSGKTSILDAVCFALYGNVPRYPAGSDARLRSDYAAPDATPRVTLDFSAGGTSYRIERTPPHERASARGEERLVSKPATVALSVRDGDGWAGLSTLSKDVGERIRGEIVRLSSEQFLQVMLLAQNRFQEFLVAESKDRRDLLRKIFGTQRFNDYVEDLRARTNALSERARDSQRIVELNVDELARLTAPAEGAAESDAADADGSPAESGSVDLTDPARLREWLGAVGGDEARRVEQARAEEQRTAGEARAAATELERQRAVRRNQDRRDTAAREHAAAEAEADDIAQLAVTIERAHHADVAWPTVERHRKAAAAVAATGTTLTRATHAYETVRASGRAALPEPDADVDAITSAAETLQGTIGALGEARIREEQLPRLTQAAKDARDAVEQQAAGRQALTERITALAAEIATANARIGGLRPPAADVELAQQHHGATTDAYAAARRAVGAQADLDTARGLRGARADEAQSAVEQRTALWQRRLDGYAASLAEDLGPTEPCPVCGSLEHPALASPTGEKVTDTMIAAADTAEKKALAAVEAAQQVVADDDKALTACLAASGARGVEELEHELALASTRLTSAREAREALTAAEAESARLATSRDETTTERDALDATRDRLTSTAAAAEATREAAQKAVDDARGEFAGVRERIERVTADRVAVVDLVGALRAAAEADDDAREAESDLAATLAEHAFDTAGAVGDARLARADVDARALRVDAHRETLAGTAKVLADPDLQDLPAEPVDLAPTEHAAGQAGAASKTATEVRATAEARARTATGFVAAINGALDASADVAANLAVVRRLFASVNGEPPNDRKMKLEDFVLAARLEEIVAAANVRLTAMTDSRYELQYSDAVQAGGRQSGLAIEVLDTHTGAPRQTHSLSGGEKFLASLALALGLAETVTAQAGGITLDTLFIDEGFGSLDSETLETAMETLDTLREGGRTVGVISHVTEMHDRIPARLDVEVTAGGWSVVR